MIRDSIHTPGNSVVIRNGDVSVMIHRFSEDPATSSDPNKIYQITVSAPGMGTAEMLVYGKSTMDILGHALYTMNQIEFREVIDFLEEFDDEDDDDSPDSENDSRQGPGGLL